MEIPSFEEYERDVMKSIDIYVAAAKVKPYSQLKMLRQESETMIEAWKKMHGHRQGEISEKIRLYLSEKFD